MKITCQLCNGAGSITYPHHSGDPQLETERECPTCEGTGEAEPDAEAVENLIAFVRDTIKMDQFSPGMLVRATRCLLAFEGK